MINNKKGAVELSITTIVVVVIGITLLVLGIAWISNLFERLGLTTGSAFEKADAQLESLLGGGGTDQTPFRVSPNSVTLKAGDTATVYAIFSNFFEDDFTDVKVTITNDDTTNTVCQRQDGTGTYTVPNKVALKIPIYIKAQEKAPIKDYTCNVKSVGNFNDRIVAGQTDVIRIKVNR